MCPHIVIAHQTMLSTVMRLVNRNDAQLPFSFPLSLSVPQNKQNKQNLITRTSWLPIPRDTSSRKGYARNGFVPLSSVTRFSTVPKLKRPLPLLVQGRRLLGVCVYVTQPERHLKTRENKTDPENLRPALLAQESADHRIPQLRTLSVYLND